MFEIQFINYTDTDNLFHHSLHKHYKGALQIVVVETNLPAYIIDYNTGEILYEHQPK